MPEFNVTIEKSYHNYYLVLENLPEEMTVQQAISFSKKKYRKMLEFFEQFSKTDTISFGEDAFLKNKPKMIFYGLENCPLCDKYQDDNCNRCPVMKKTGERNCKKSPFGKILRAKTIGEAIENIKLEIQFLKGLK
jgi:hypothetical protein